MRLVLTEHELFISEEVIAELTRTLNKKFKLSMLIVESTIEFLREYQAEQSYPVPLIPPIRDPDDENILRSALATGAEVLVTGDRDLLDVADSISVLRIVSPRGFWELLRRGT
jgi:putative PIN family toxin of toxin-antitoxin system